MRDGNWEHKPNGNWAGEFKAVTSSGLLLNVTLDANTQDYILTLDGKLVTTGDLEAVFEAGNAYLG